MNIQLYSSSVFMNISMAISLILFMFLGFLFITFIISLFLKTKRTIKRAGMEASIVIPVYNEELNIVNCLNSLLKADYPKALLEVIVVDDGSTDSTPLLVQDFMLKNKALNVRLLNAKHKGKVEALNKGVRAAKNEIIITVDADVTLSRDTIRKLVEPMSDPKVGASNSIALIKEPRSIIEHFQHIEFCLNSLIRTSFSDVFNNSVWFFGAVACYRKSVLKKIGYFKKNTMTEDMDICLEMYNRDYKIITVRDAVILTEPMPSVARLFRQRMRWYFGALQSLVKNRSLLRKNSSPPIMFLFFNQFWWTFFSFVFFPMTAYQIQYWLPSAPLEIVSYILRWFSVVGPFYVLYKLPVWGLNFLNIFGVLSGIITLVMGVAALAKFRARFYFKTAICLIFYFPYTIIHDAIIIAGVLKFPFSKKRYFIN